MSIQTPVSGDTKLEKQLTRTFVPGDGGVPTIFGSPGVPAHYITVTERVPPSPIRLPPGWGWVPLFNAVTQAITYTPAPFTVEALPEGINGAGIALPIGAFFSYTRFIPAEPGTPSVPGRPVVDAQIIIDNNVGWNAQGFTAAELTGAGKFTWLTPIPVVGVMNGLSDSIADRDYTSMSHAVYQSHGTAQVVENGAILLSTTRQYTDTDVLSIVVDGLGGVRYCVNNVLWYRSTLGAPRFVRLMSMPYFANDATYNINHVSQTQFNTSESGLNGIAGIQFFGFAFSRGQGTSGAAANYSAGTLRFSGSCVAGQNHANVSVIANESIGFYGFGFSRGEGTSGDPLNYAEGFIRFQSNIGTLFSGNIGGNHALGFFPQFIGLASDRPYNGVGGPQSPNFGQAGGYATIPAFTGHAASGEITPQYVAAQGFFGFYGGALALLYQRANVHSTMPRFVGIASDLANYTYMNRPLPRFFGEAFSYPVGYAFLSPFAFAADAMSPTKHMFAAVLSIGKISMPFIGTITLPNFFASNAVVSDYLTMRDLLFFTIASTVTASDSMEETTSIALRLLASFMSTGVATDAMSDEETSAALALYAFMHERIRVGGLGDFSLPLTAPNGETWVINLERGPGGNAVSRYEGFDFNSYARFNGKHYGVRDDGIYLLGGDTDSGAPIQASIDFGNLNFGSLGLKRPTNAYLGITSSGAILLKVTADVNGERKSYLYTARNARVDAATQRVDFGRGLDGNYLNFELFNGSGEDFNMDAIEFMALPLAKRVR